LIRFLFGSFSFAVRFEKKKNDHDGGKNHQHPIPTIFFLGTFSFIVERKSSL